MERRLNETAAGWLFLISYVTGVLLTAFMTASGSPHHDNHAAFLGYVIAGQVGLNLLPAVVWCKLRRIPFREAFRLRRVSLRALVLSLLIFVVSQVILLFFHQLTELAAIAAGANYETSHYPIADSLGTLLLLAVSIGIIPPICEELLFRGALLSGYARGGVWFSAAVTAGLFALFHDNPYRLAELFVSAWIAASIVLRTRSVYPGLLVHLVTNLTYVCVSYWQGGDMLEGLTAAEGPKLAAVALTGLASVAAFFVCRWLWLKIEPAGQRQEEGGSLRLRAAWLLPIVLAVIAFIVKFVWNQ
ncbi:membrane protease YdiL (CAAX protease family) [Paenibacillus phyllosphaerae]|uniref:Membrane protease YdiL (CAAX protease family) n=1 Tax=Paenibacillus phyllosphaerae TaxID=274593 RepID=A0A7W5FP49_9BACL|nr:type II CAAX endopeptidase family protein [Paenibacillus phyllosphaerae]MBB3111852.1 membrane protease YdiL (CAAX protease family) [Paenibacillus phyllosphaerae]